MSLPNQKGHPSGVSRTGSVVLDIGGAVGAAVVYCDRSLDGSEIEIRRQDDGWDGTHTAVRPRMVGDGLAHAGVFESLDEGWYEMRVRGGPGPTVLVRVAGGAVTEVVWPSLPG